MARSYVCREQAPRRVGSKRWHWRRYVGLTTGVTTLFRRGIDGGQTGNDTTRPVTQVGLRTVKAGLRGHDDGVSRVDEGVETSTFHRQNGVDWHGRNRAPSVDLQGQKMKCSRLSRNSKTKTITSLGVIFCILRLRKMHADDRIVETATRRFDCRRLGQH